MNMLVLRISISFCAPIHEKNVHLEDIRIQTYSLSLLPIRINDFEVFTNACYIWQMAYIALYREWFKQFKHAFQWGELSHANLHSTHCVLWSRDTISQSGSDAWVSTDNKMYEAQLNSRQNAVFQSAMKESNVANG